MDCDLSDAGLKQATLAGMALKEEIFDVAITSDLKRASKTCKEVLRLNNNFNSPMIADQLLREQCYGILEGTHFSVFRPYVAAQTAKDSVIEGLEPAAEFTKRTMKFTNVRIISSKHNSYT